MERMEGEGLRVMAAALPRPRPGRVRPGRRPARLRRRTCEMTSLVGMVDPPRDESKAAVADAQAAHIRVRMVTGDDVITGAAIAKQLGIPGEAILGAEFAALSRGRAAGPHRRHRRRRPRRPRAQGAARRDAQEEGRRRRDDRRRRQRRAGDQGRRHRHRHGQRHRGRQERRPDDPLRRQLRDDRLRGRAGPQDLRQPHQVHPLRADLARRVRPDVPRREPVQHRRRASRSRPAQVLWIHFFVNAPFGVRARLRPGDARADAAAAAAARRVDPDHGRDASPSVWSACP